MGGGGGNIAITVSSSRAPEDPGIFFTLTWIWDDGENLTGAQAC